MSREEISPIVIQRQLGHADLAITSRYLRGIDNRDHPACVSASRADDPCQQTARARPLTPSRSPHPWREVAARSLPHAFPSTTSDLAEEHRASTDGRRRDRRRRAGTCDEKTRQLMPVRETAGDEPVLVPLRRPGGVAWRGAGSFGCHSSRELQGGKPAGSRVRPEVGSGRFGECRFVRRRLTKACSSAVNMDRAVFARRMLGRGSATTMRSASWPMTSVDRSLRGV